MLFSILIPTLRERRAEFERLEGRLKAQVSAGGMADRVEIVALCDDREQSVGAKRNKLLEMARGEFTAFVDDDDGVHEDYVGLIARALRENPGVDCLGINGLVYFRGVRPKRFVHSARYDRYFSRGGVYYRPPYILNPMRRSIARSVPFEDVSFSEDIDWALRLAEARVWRHEVMLPEVLYHYFCRRRWYVQAAIDFTEPVRHPLGLQCSSRLRLRRTLRGLMRRGR